MQEGEFFCIALAFLFIISLSFLCFLKLKKKEIGQKEKMMQV